MLRLVGTTVPPPQALSAASSSSMLPAGSIHTIRDAFRPEFTARTRTRFVTLTLGTILARGRRTVAAALLQMGLHDDPDFSSYHQVFNRAAWSPLRLARRPLTAVIAAF